ncbi:hypothetical protein NTHI1209_00484 [Haemophilus influenzae]|uniref:Uncharacterized protein n=1 Tax=Haemophilus influenzae TaxID=727 RepID=A0A158SVI7_HAEIF|nr:hypothetical protein NTHI1209_00484 [Haemophilus influenzae]
MESNKRSHYEKCTSKILNCNNKLAPNYLGLIFKIE